MSSATLLRGVWIGFAPHCEECEADLSPSGWIHDTERDWPAPRPDPRFPYHPLCPPCADIWAEWLDEAGNA